MKKILTLMAAMSAASGALAHDYNWTGLQNPTVDKNNEVKDCAGLTFANNTFTFEVNAKDAITLNVNGDNISVSLDGTNLKTTTENGKITFTASNNGKVTVTLGENTAVTKIVVVSDYTVQMNKLIADAQAELKDATGKTAKYSNLKNGEYFTKVRAGINEQGEKIESIIAAFETAKEKDEVGTNFEAWEADLKTNIPNALEKIVADAATCKAKYDQILGLAGNTRAQLAKFGTNVPTNKDVKTADLAAAYNNGINSIYNFAANKDGDNKNATNVGAKTSWIVAAHNAYANKAMSEIENAAYAELCSQFPNTITTDYQTKYYDAAVVAEQNMIARAVIEGDSNLGYKAKIDALNNNISNIETVVAKGDPFKLPAEDNLDFTTLKQNVSQLAAFISSTNYYEYSLGEMKNMLESGNNGSYKYAKDAYDGIIAAFINQAKTALNAEIETVDKLIKDYAYKVSAKYQKEPATQKTYEKKFAELQTRLDNVKNVVAAGDFAKVVTEYDARLKEINDITPEVKALWDETCGEQVTAVRNNNTKAQDALNTTIDSIRKDIYDKYVNKIVEWKAADATKAVAGELDVNLKNLFSIVGGLDVQKQNIQEYMDKLNTAIDGAIAKDGEAAFDPNNNIYRFAQDSINSFNAQIEAIKKGINSEIKKAVYTANFQAAKYLLNYSGEYDDINTYESVDRTIISKVDQTGSEWEQGNLYAGKNGELMSAAAQDKFTKAYNSIRRKDENGNGEGLLNEAFNVIASKCLSVYNATADQIEAQCKI